MRAPPPALAQPFSVYLDLARFLAAVMVVLAHFRYFGVIPATAWGVLPEMGREAVILFFVLSGFVIASSVAQRRPCAREYAVARLSRLYSVALPVLLLALAGAAALRSFTDVTPPTAYVLDKLHIYLPLHLLFLGQHWNLSEVAPFMVPYWSLGYEAWYYLLFGLACYLRGTRRVVLVALALAVMGYKLWLLLPVWLAGVCLFHRHHRQPGPWLPPGLARIGWLATLLLLGAWVGSGAEEALRAAGNARWPFPGLPLGSADRFLADYTVCALVLANFACARDAGFTALARIAPAVRLLASYTFTLYLSHALVIGLWLALYPHDPHSAGHVFAVTAVVAASTAALGAVTERRRYLYRSLFARLLGARRMPLSAVAVAEKTGA